MRALEWVGDPDLQRAVTERLRPHLVGAHPLDGISVLSSMTLEVVVIHSDDETEALKAVAAIADDMAEAVRLFYCRRRGAH